VVLRLVKGSDSISNNNSIDEILQKLATNNDDPDIKTTTTIFAMALLYTRKDMKDMKEKLNKIQYWIYYLFFTVIGTLIVSILVKLTYG